jgi:hypothetical protein
LANFGVPPEWSGSNIFQKFSANGTVSTSGGGITADEALEFLISKDLPGD